MIVKPQSKLLGMVQVGQELRVRLVAPRGSSFRAGSYRGRITQITELVDGAYKGHLLVGVALSRRAEPGLRRPSASPAGHTPIASNPSRRNRQP